MTQLPRKLRFAYMDHWRIDGPQGYVSPYTSVKLLDGFVKQIPALRFEGLETFDFHLGVLLEPFGSLPNACDSCRSAAPTASQASFTQSLQERRDQRARTQQA